MNATTSRDGARSRHSRIHNPKSRIRRGYSFAEVLFAVAVLGIGFIMVAAIFPVAISQTQAAMDETIGTTTTRNGAMYLQGTQFFTSTMLPNTCAPGGNPQVFMFGDPRVGLYGPAGPPTPPNAAQLWDSIKSNLVAPSDRRFGIVALYSRAQGVPFAKLVVFGMRIRNREAYVGEDKNTANNPPQTDVDRNGNILAELEPRPILIQVQNNNANGPDYCWIDNLTQKGTPQETALANLSSASGAVAAAAEGAYVIVSDDRVNDDTTGTPGINENGLRNGKIYQLGAEVTGTANATAPPTAMTGTTRQFELVPGQDLLSDDENIPAISKNAGTKAAIGFVVGRGYAAFRGNPAGYSGGVAVVQRFETVVPLP
jgi:hypothetical protein